MTKTDIVKALRKQSGGEFITKTGIARCLGMKRSEYVNRFTDGLQKVNGKYYYIPEVAGRIAKEIG